MLIRIIGADAADTTSSIRAASPFPLKSLDHLFRDSALVLAAMISAARAARQEAPDAGEDIDS